MHDGAGVVLCLQEVDLVEVHLVKVVHHLVLDVLLQDFDIVVPVICLLYRMIQPDLTQKVKYVWGLIDVIYQAKYRIVSTYHVTCQFCSARARTRQRA